MKDFIREGGVKKYLLIVLNWMKRMLPVLKHYGMQFRRALSLLTRLPVSAQWDPDQPWGKLAGWFPATGLVIGVILVLIAWGWDKVADPTLIGSALILLIWVGLTGALHLDGLGDCADAFFTPVTRERRLEIMRDPHIGSFGTVGLVLALLLKFSVIVQVMVQLMGASEFWWQIRALWPLITAAVAGRMVMVGVLAFRWIPLAHPGGMGDKAREGLGKKELIGAAATAVVVALLGGWLGVFMLLAAAVAGAGVVFLAWRRIGGITGDVLGAVVETGEITALAVVSLKMFGN